MPDQPKHRAYEVLMLEETDPDDEIGGAVYRHLGIVNAGGADAAIQAVVQRQPFEGRYVAVPQSNWNERDVEVRQVPEVEVNQVGETPQLVPEDGPVDLPPAEG